MATKARSREFASPILVVEPEELPEQVPQLVGWHALSLVGYGERDVQALPHGADPDCGRIGGVPGGIGEEIPKHLDDALPVCHYQGKVVSEVDVDLASSLFRSERCSSPRRLDQSLSPAWDPPAASPFRFAPYPAVC